MKVAWWQDGLHIRPETNVERQWLSKVLDLEFTQLDHEVHSGPTGAVEFRDQKPVIAVHESPEVVPEAGA